MKIYITRHSKTLWNEQRRLQGCKDSPLTKIGKENALALRDHIKDLSFDAIYSSPIQRAYTTATLLFGHDDMIIKDDRIREMNFGILEGCSIDELTGEKQKEYNDLWKHPEYSLGIEGGESYDDIENRVRDFLDDLKKSGNEKVFVVTHGFCFIIMLGMIMGLKRQDYTKINSRVVDGCSLTIVDYSNHRFTVEQYGDNSYLPHITNENFVK